MSAIQKGSAKKLPSAKKAVARPAAKKAVARPVAKKAVAKPAAEKRRLRQGKFSDLARTMPPVQRSPGAIRRLEASHLFRADEDSLSRALVNEVGGPDVARLCRVYGLRREELGRLTGFSLRALAEWNAGKIPGAAAKRRLHEVRRMLDAVAEIVEIEAIPAWLHQPNAAFDRLTPLQVIEVGEIDRLWHMIHDLRSGQPG